MFLDKHIGRQFNNVTNNEVKDGEIVAHLFQGMIDSKCYGVEPVNHIRFRNVKYRIEILPTPNTKLQLQES